MIGYRDFLAMAGETMEEVLINIYTVKMKDGSIFTITGESGAEYWKQKDDVEWVEKTNKHELGLA